MSQTATPIIWITGASSGIGRALAAEWSRRGAAIILSGRDERRLAETAAECAGETLVLPFETTDDAALARAAEQAHGWRGQIDVLVNNAGISQRSRALETDMAVYRRIVEVDLLAPIALTQAVIGPMAARGNGRLVFISSVAGKVGVPLRTAYCAAKHGLIGYADALRAELSQSGVSVYVVCPGSVATDVSRNALQADGSRRGVSDKAIDGGLPPGEAAREMLDAILRGEREIIVARGFEQAMGETRRTPEALLDQVAAMVASGYMDRLKADR